MYGMTIPKYQRLTDEILFCRFFQQDVTVPNGAEITTPVNYYRQFEFY
jgi:hypothetical protein